MEKKALTPISFLKSKEMRQKYECGICTQVCVKPVRCRGPCGRIYCMKCVSDWRQAKDECPVKCSAPFLVSPLPDIQLDFACPYNPSDCHIPITSLKAFEQHHSQCVFVPVDQRLRLSLKHEYKCLNNHQLQFFIGSYQQMLQSQCKQCGQVRLCRSICRRCDQLYCVSCRIPPCSKQDCPIGHKYNFQRIANLNYICDMCGISTSVSNDGVYDDPYCNFGICQACHSQLPQHFDPSKPRELIANINTRCCCGATLVETDAIHKLSSCQLCHRKKQCYKKCNDCARMYCLKCKMIDIQNDNTCGHDHQFIELDLKNYPKSVQIQNEHGCMRCSTQCQTYYFDRQCRVRLCQQCFLYCRRATGDKKRCIIVKCDLNHVLTYLAGPQDYYDACSQCHQIKSIKLRCMFCEEEYEGQTRNKCYCFQCRPVKLDTCYYKHKLKLAQFQSERQCHFCTKQFNTFHYCKKCYFYVCRGCYQKNQKKYEGKMEEEEEVVGGKEGKYEGVNNQEEGEGVMAPEEGDMVMEEG